MRIAKRLLARLKTSGISVGKQDDRLLKEIAIFSDRCDIQEEVARLQSHFQQVEHSLQSKEPVGRVLDFLSQEMLREVNTIGSKAQDIRITKQVIQFKKCVRTVSRTGTKHRMITHQKPSVLLIVSAPSGAGKTTLCNRLLHEDENIRYSISCTTRPPRVGEVNGQHYHFMNMDDFQERVSRNEFLEYAEVHGAMYGTLKSHVQEIMAGGHDVLMDLDVQGADLIRSQIDSIREQFENEFRYTDVFIAPPSMEVLEKRIRGRGLDQDDVIRRRMENAVVETHRWSSYRYLIVNDHLDDSYTALHSILVAERHRLTL